MKAGRENAADGARTLKQAPDWDEASKFRTLADSIDEGFCVVEIVVDDAGHPVDYRFLEVNRVFESQTGLLDPVGKRMRDLAPDHESFWAETYGQVAETGQPVRFEHAAEALGRWYDVFAFRVGAPAERKVAILFQDISLRVRARVALGAAERRKDEFIAILAHELRNPLAPMRTAVHLARMATRLEDVARPLEILDRQIAHMAELVSDLADIGRVARGLVQLDLAPCDLRDAVRHAAEIARPSMEVRSQRFHQAIPDRTVAAQADLRRLTQALSNLLLNASKYTPAGGRIALSLRVEPDWAVVEVADDGIGIAEDRLADIFDLFSQVQSARKHAQGGLGIGLAVAKNIAQLHGGWIEALSEGPARGSTFRLGLPLPPAA